MFLIAGILGVLEGLSEFLPISSTGHLILAGQLLNFTGAKAATFEIFIQLGAILSIVVLYFSKFKNLLDFRKSQGFSGARGVMLLAATTLPALILGAGLHHTIKAHLFNPKSVALALAVGGLWILLIEKIRPKEDKTSLDQINLKSAFLIGCFQCLALWPGFSRAGATILGAMMLGADRKTATEYSFFAAVPVMAAATAFDLLKSIHALSASDLPIFVFGFIAAFVTALATVKLFVGFVSKNTLSLFGWYRLALSAAVLLIWR